MMIVIQSDDGMETQRLTRDQADQLIEEGGWVEVGTYDGEEPPHDLAIFDPVTKQDVIDPVAAEVLAMLELEEASATAATHEVTTSRQHIAIMSIWNELQRLKLANSLKLVPADVTERRKQYPGLEAIAYLSGKTLTQVATAIDERLWDRVRRLNLWQAKLLMGEDAIRSAATGEEKLAVVPAIQWTE